MNFTNINEKAVALLSEAIFLSQINDEHEYEIALG